MVKRVLLSGLLLIFLHNFSSYALLEGFYKDVFQDEGTQINGGNLKIDCDYIKYTMEHLDTEDKTLQSSVMIKNSNDDNGYLLYPDGGPRFAIIFYHGGYMGHSSDLGTAGRDIIRKHYYNGGSQFGSCAGSYMLSSSSTTYFKIWPGKMNGPNVSNTSVDRIINAGSPFIGINGFKAGDIIAGVYHNNGGSVDTNNSVKGTVFCAMNNAGTMKGYADIWAWKDNDTTGRALGHCGHPEGSSKTDQIRYISASMLYITQGLGKPGIKHKLNTGQTITMDKTTKDSMPLFTKIGDMQYHHFLLNCESAQNVKITVEGQTGFDFHVFVAKDTFAFKQKALYSDSTAGNAKTLNIPTLASGKWYVGVKLNTTVTAGTGTGFPTYSGKLEVLNGISYTIKAEWQGQGIFDLTEAAVRQQLAIVMQNKNVRINTGNLPVKQLQVYTVQGKLCWEPKVNEIARHYSWKPDCAGMYVVRLVCGKNSFTVPLSVVK